MSHPVDALLQKEINDVVWRACDTFRGVIDPANYKDYILVVLFLKYLSDFRKDRISALRQQFSNNEEMIQRRLQRERFVLPEEATFDSLYYARNEDNIGERINNALDEIEEANKIKLEGVFRSVDFNSEANLGETKERNRRLKHLLEDFANEKLDLRPSRIGSVDIIGNCYIYLISNFASDAGKKGGEFYTPNDVARLLARLVAPKSGDRICDPACGSGGLLIEAFNLVPDGNCSVYGQEINGGTLALAKMNMFLHGIDNARLEWCDTLNNPKLIQDDRLMRFNVVIANPPFSLDKWGAEHASEDKFKRFWRGIPPKSKGDWAFITHMVETALEGEGRVGVIVPHGVLFRSGSEGVIRRSMIEENLLKAIIGLPEKLFFGTGIPGAILIFDKGKVTKDVLFIDASREFIAGTKQHRLGENHISTIVRAFERFQTLEKYAYRASPEKIEANDFNLNISRYVETFELEEPADLYSLQAEISQIQEQLSKVRGEIDKKLRELLSK
jgi:type I restriction enzyme M protein